MPICCRALKSSCPTFHTHLYFVVKTTPLLTSRLPPVSIVVFAAVTLAVTVTVFPLRMVIDFAPAAGVTQLGKKSVLLVDTSQIAGLFQFPEAFVRYIYPASLKAIMFTLAVSLKVQLPFAAVAI